MKTVAKVRLFSRGKKGEATPGTKTAFRNYRKLQGHGCYRIDLDFWRRYSDSYNPGPVRNGQREMDLVA